MRLNPIWSRSPWPPTSQPLHDLCCVTRATLLHLSLTNADLKGLGLWEESHRARPSAAVLSRLLLHRDLQHGEGVARRVIDFLDLRHMDTILSVRTLDPEAAEGMVERWLTRPDGERLPGLVWALCTDGRPRVRRTGMRLCHEALALACQGLVRAPHSLGTSTHPGS